MSYLLDTCFISEVVAKQPQQQVLDWLDNQDPETLFLSVITMGEIAKGIHKLVPSRRQLSLKRWLEQELPAQFAGRILGIDTQTMLIWGKLVGELEQGGRSLPVMDSLIAAIALQHSLTLVTRNENDFKGTNLEIVNPWVFSE
ncbi:MAG: type II toxin-antitoxin system VapC family toxin [Limnospira sp.]